MQNTQETQNDLTPSPNNLRPTEKVLFGMYLGSALVIALSTLLPTTITDNAPLLTCLFLFTLVTLPTLFLAGIVDLIILLRDHVEVRSKRVGVAALLLTTTVPLWLWSIGWIVARIINDSRNLV
jgi:hypothetical protein